MRFPHLSAFPVLLLLATTVAAQPPRGSGGGFDIGVIFDRMDANKDGVVTRDELKDQRALEWFDDLVRRAGVTDGRLTREGFMKAFRERMEERSREGIGRYRGGRGSYGGGAGRQSQESSRAPDPPSRVEPPKKDAPPVVHRGGNLPAGLPDWFTELDKDGDGQVGMHEWKGRPIKEFLAADANSDGFITIAEGLRLASGKNGKSAATSASSDSGPNSQSPPPESKTEGKDPASPSVPRARKLPAGLPDWFTELDKDGDGQVGMHEWKGRPIKEFLADDGDGDGFITIAEGLRLASGKECTTVQARTEKEGGTRNEAR